MRTGTSGPRSWTWSTSRPTETPVPQARPRLIVLGLGVDQSRNPAVLPPVAFADRDARDLADFLADHLVSPDGGRTIQDPREDRRLLTGEGASAASLGRELERLGEWARTERLRKGDIVAVVIAAHVLEFDGTSAIAAADTDPARAAAHRPDDRGTRRLRAARRAGRLRLPRRGLPRRRPRAARRGVAEHDQAVGAGPAAGAAGHHVRGLARGAQRYRMPVREHGLFALGVMRAFQQVVRRRQSRRASPTRWTSSAGGPPDGPGPERPPAGGVRLLPAWRLAGEPLRPALIGPRGRRRDAIIARPMGRDPAGSGGSTSRAVWSRSDWSSRFVAAGGGVPGLSVTAVRFTTRSGKRSAIGGRVSLT